MLIEGLNLISDNSLSVYLDYSDSAIELRVVIDLILHFLVEKKVRIKIAHGNRWLKARPFNSKQFV